MIDLVQYVNAAQVPLCEDELVITVFDENFGDICYITNVTNYNDQKFLGETIARLLESERGINSKLNDIFSARPVE